MNRYVALLRGINVGGNNKVEMSRLKKLFESLGFKHVSTYINSGNIIFDTEIKSIQNLVEIIEKALKKEFNFEIQILIRDKKNIENLCKVIPASWKNDIDQKTDILFLWDTFDTKKTLLRIATNPLTDTLIYTSGAIVWNVKKEHYTKSGMKKFIGTQVYKHMTARNVNTVRRLKNLLY